MAKAGLLILAGAAVALAQDGVVRSGGQAITGSTVVATSGTQKFSVLTDEEGRYHFTVLPPGDWTVKIATFGFVSQKKQLAIAAASSAGLSVETWNLELRPKPAAPAPTSCSCPEFREPQARRVPECRSESECGGSSDCRRAGSCCDAGKR